MIRSMVERVQIERVAPATRMWALAATAYCVVVALSFSAADPDLRWFSWGFGAFFALITAIPQPFRRRTVFLAACGTSIVLLAVSGFFALMVGGCYFLPAIVPMVLAAALDRPAPPQSDAIPWRERLPGVSKRLAVAALILGVLFVIAAMPA
ncbi:hypothetical protein [Actinoplanes sp. NPDC049681]|uniref:hypothetical protein n=1 Tax=Actinoplanes sp. NPDC049681 TaxID=3363905 RepID=UPI00379EDCE3